LCVWQKAGARQAQINLPETVRPKNDSTAVATLFG
jgi:hypothetical protein